MATLKEQLMADIKAAMKAGNQEELTTLRGISATLKNAEIAKQVKEGASATLSDQEVMNVFLAEQKKRKDSINAYKTGGRPELAEGEEKELALIQRYLPKQMSPEETAAAVEKIIAGQTEMSGAMKLAMAELRGKADTALVSEIIRKKFAK